MSQFKYLSPEWAKEATARLKQELTPEVMKFITSDMLTIYTNCPDGKDRSLYYKFEKGEIVEVSVLEGRDHKAEFIITGDYETFAKISRAELGARPALMSGKLRLQGNMVKALSLSPVVDRLNKVLATIPTEF